jgi:hypothetical protein
MRNTEHELKTHDIYWDAVDAGEKLFEVRRNDRAFQTGDTLVLLRTNDRGLVESPFRKIHCEITYLLQGGQFGIEPGYCILGIRKMPMSKHL